MDRENLPIGRFLGILAGWFVIWAAGHGVTLNEAEILVLFTSVYSAVHTMYREWRKRSLNAPKGIN